MYFKDFVYATGLALVVIIAGGAAFSAQDKQCFEIAQVEPNPTFPPQYLLNKCTGESWILLKSRVEPEGKDEKESYSWGWHPVLRYEGFNQVQGK